MDVVQETLDESEHSMFVCTTLLRTIDEQISSMSEAAAPASEGGDPTRLAQAAHINNGEKEVVQTQRKEILKLMMSLNSDAEEDGQEEAEPEEYWSARTIHGNPFLTSQKAWLANVLQQQFSAIDDDTNGLLGRVPYAAEQSYFHGDVSNADYAANVSNKVLKVFAETALAFEYILSRNRLNSWQSWHIRL